MKKPLRALPVSLFLVVSLVFAPLTYARTVPTSVSDVTVYPDTALVTRSADIDLSGGEQMIELSGFPAAFDIETMRLEVSNASVRVGQVDVKANKFLEAKDPAVIELKKKIAAKENQIREVTDSTSAAQLQLKFLDSLATGYSKQAWAGSAQGSADVSSWQRALTLMQTGSETANKTIRENILTTETLSIELNLLKRELADKRSVKASNNSVVAYLSSAGPIKTTVSVYYLQQNAGWEPSYEARLNTSSGRLLLAQKAVISQYTEEPWVNAKLTLSTSEPSEEMEPPILSSEFYDLQKIEPSRSRYSRAKAPQSVSAEAAPGIQEIVVTAAKVRRGWSGSYSQNYDIPGRITVSNDNDQAQRYDLTTFEFDTTLVTQISPMQSTQAFLSARLIHQGRNPIYGDQMLVFVDGVLMGLAEMPTILPGAEVSLPMGVDRRIEVSVDDLGGQGGDKGIVKKQTSEVTNLRFEVINRRSSSAAVEVTAVYPVSKNKALKIKLADDATPPSESNYDGEAGVVLWKKDLSSGESWKIRFGYSKTWPEGRNVQRVYR